MTADKLFDRVLALMFSDDTEKSDLRTQFLAVLNIHLLELLPQENGFREEKLTEPQIVAGLDDELIYNSRILAVLPYGIAGTMLAEDEPSIAAQYKNKYEEGKAGCVTARFREAVEYYG